MADPLSIAASIAGLISLADIVFIRLVKFGRSVKNAEKEIQDLSKEINLLGGALNSLARLARALEDGHFDTNLRMHNIEDCSDTLKDMDKRLQKLEKSSSLTKQKLMWPFTKDRVQEWLEELSQHKVNINLALSANSLDAMLRLLSQEDNHATEILAEIKETRKITSRIHQDSERQKVLKFFLKYNPQQNYDMSMHLRHPRTGLWLQRLPEFQHWISTPDSNLWLKGIPGAGKTVLAGSIIEAALKRSTEATPSAFFFCDYKEGKTHVIENILGALVYQLAIQKEDAYTMLERYYDELHPNNSLPKQPIRKALQKLLRKMLELFDHAYLIIDGLDECGKSTDEVVESLSDISEGANNVSIALLSRDEDDIRNRLEGDFISIEISAHKDDITEYVTAEIEERIRTQKLRIGSLDLKGEILQGLIEGAKGMFRWVACQLDHLGDCDSDQQCRDALKSLPPTLDETYERILGRVPKSKQVITELALNCIAHASPKLNIRQLREILSVPAPGTLLDAGAIIREESITRYCSSMVRKSTDGLYLEFSHFSVQEFLEKGSTQREWLRVSEPRAYALLAVQCLKFIQLQNFHRTNIEAESEKDQIASRNQLHPLYFHASTRWPVYARGEWENQTVFDLAASLFHPSKTPYFTSWAIDLATGIQADPVVDIEKTVSLLIDPDLTPLHMAAALSLPRICSFLVEHGMRVNLESPVGRPLQCAVQSLQFDTTNCELDYHEWVIPKLQKNQQDHVATVDTIRCLCRAGASLNIQCCSPYSAMSLVQVSLVMFAHSMTYQVTMALIQEGARLEEADALIVKGHTEYPDMWEIEAVVQEFIEFLNKFTDQSPAHHRIISILWERAAEFNFAITLDPTTIDTKFSLTNDALGKYAVAAVTGANIPVLKRIMCDERFNVTTFADDNGDSLLHLALCLYYGANTESLEVIILLLDAGCDVTMTNRKGMDPLKCWDWHADDMENPTAQELESFDKAARLFADHGARCDHQDPENRTALHLHISEPFRLRALLKHQPAASVKKAMETVDNDGYTPLTLSLCKMHVRSASILLAQQPTVTAKMAQSPIAALSLSVRAGDENAFEAFRLSGIDFPFEDNETPLHHVGPATSVHFFRRLKTLYAEACRQRFNGYTPLESYLKCCLETDGVRNINDSVIDELTPLDVSVNTKISKAATWECFTSRILSSAIQLPRLHVWTGVEGWNQKDDRQLVSETASKSLIRLGYLESFETCFEKSAVIPLLQSLSVLREISDLWKQMRDLIFEVLCQTQHWDSFRESSSIILFLKASVRSFDPRTVKLLLDNGISVHQRADGMSALEDIVSGPRHDRSVSVGDQKEILDLVLSHCDKARINDVIPNGSGFALIHLAKTWDAEWIIKRLVDHGANPNLRASEEPHAPPLIHYLSQNQSDYATAILNNGADPTLTDDDGYDAALMAVWKDEISILIKIHDDSKNEVKKNWHNNMDWGRKCEVDISVGNKLLTCRGVTALHLGAFCPFADVLRFYNDQKLIKDLDLRTDEGYSPLHFAASEGRVSNIEYLSTRGCDVNARAKDGSSPLHIAVRNDDMEAARALIKAGCKSSIDSVGMTPAFYARQASNKDLAALLDSVHLSTGVASGDSPKQQLGLWGGRPRDKTLALALRNAVAMNDLALCKSLHVNASDLAISLNNCAGGSLVSEATLLKRVAIVEWMLQEGVSMTTAIVVSKPPSIGLAIHLVLKDADVLGILSASLENYAKNGGRLLGETPNMASTAVLGNNIEGLEVLLQHAKDNRDYYGSLWSVHPDGVVSALVNEADASTGWTPMHTAARCGALKAVQVLLQSGADIDAVESMCLQAPIHVAIGSNRDLKETVALHLIQEGANLERRDFQSKTPALRAAEAKRTRTLSALINAKVDVHVTDDCLRTIPRFLVQRGSATAFADLVHRGVNPHRVDTAGCSAFHQAIKSASFIPFLVNSELRLEDSSPFPWHVFSGAQTSWLTTAYPVLLKRYGLQALGEFANLVPITGSEAPLCNASKRGSVLVMESLLELGAPIDLEGCPSGSALMAACEFGRKTSVEYLVRRGAALSYTGVNGFRSAFQSAKGDEEILRWLLVGRFIDQLKLTNDSDGNSYNVKDRGASFWGGPIKAELVIGGQMERLPHESSRQYWSRLMREKIKWRGKILPSNTRRRTVSPSNIVPQEMVRIHPQGYNSNGLEEDWFSKKVAKIQSDGGCWYLSYIDKP